MDAVVRKGKAIQDYGLTLFIPSFLVSDSDFLIIMILYNLGKNQINLMSISLSWVFGDRNRNQELRIGVILQDSFNTTSMKLRCGLADYGCKNKKSSACQNTRNNIEH